MLPEKVSPRRRGLIHEFDARGRAGGPLELFTRHHSREGDWQDWPSLAVRDARAGHLPALFVP